MNIGHGVYNNNAMLGVFYNLLFCKQLNKWTLGGYMCLSLYVVIMVIYNDLIWGPKNILPLLLECLRQKGTIKHEKFLRLFILLTWSFNLEFSHART